MTSKLKHFFDSKHRSDEKEEHKNEKLASNNPYRDHEQQERDLGYNVSPSQPQQPSAYDATPNQVRDDQAPPSYDPWLAVPDSTLLPPPPPMKEDFSPANNASADDAARAHQWCYYNPIWGPRTWSGPELSQMQHKQYTLAAPPNSSHMKISHSGRGRTLLESARRQGDITVLSNLPLYIAQDMLQPGEQRTIYYQIHIKHLTSADAAVAIGFLAPPYPPNRLPGWHRGSLAVHNDDGRRYVNDDAGGTPFARPFSRGETVGLGMTFTGTPGQPNVRVFFTRNGREEGSWNLHESLDVNDGGVMGLDGTTDIYAAIGVCSGTELEVLWDV